MFYTKLRLFMAVEKPTLLHFEISFYLNFLYINLRQLTDFLKGLDLKMFLESFMSSDRFSSVMKSRLRDKCRSIA